MGIVIKVMKRAASAIRNVNPLKEDKQRCCLSRGVICSRTGPILIKLTLLREDPSPSRNLIFTFLFAKLFL